MTNPTQDITSLDYGKSEAELAAQKAASEGGAAQVTEVYVDFWGTDTVERWEFPGQENVREDMRQYIDFKPMNEGARARYQKDTNKGVVIERATNNARMGIDPAGDREALFRHSVTDWRLAQGGALIRFSHAKFQQWYQNANPKLIDDLEKAIREKNEWMKNELTSEAIQEEIDSLQTQLEETKKKEAKERDFRESGS